MRERFSLPDQYYKDQHRDEADEAISDVEGSHKHNAGAEKELEEDVSPTVLREQLGFANLKIDGWIHPSKYSLARKTIESLKELSDVVSEKILANIEKFCEEKGRPTQKIMNYVLENNLNQPLFTIVADSELADIRLNECGYEYNHISEHGLLVIFNLPRQIAKHWEKGGTDSWGMGGIPGDYFIEWGRFYRNMMPTVWGFLDYMCREGEVGFDRLSGTGDHDPEKFYYLWEAYDQEPYAEDAAA